MTRTLVIATIADVISLASEKGFFESAASSRRAMSKKRFGGAWVPEVVAWIAKTNGDGFLSALRGATEYATSGSWPKDDTLLRSIAAHLANGFTDAMDAKDVAVRKRKSSPSAKKSFLVVETKRILAAKTARELVAGIRPFLTRGGFAKSITVKSATELGPVLRADIRARMRERSPDAYAVFHVDTDLAGGMRIFMDGTLKDASWLSEIDRLFSQVMTNGSEYGKHATA